MLAFTQYTLNATQKLTLANEVLPRNLTTAGQHTLAVSSYLTRLLFPLFLPFQTLAPSVLGGGSFAKVIMTVLKLAIILLPIFKRRILWQALLRSSYLYDFVRFGDIGLVSHVDVERVRKDEPGKNGGGDACVMQCMIAGLTLLFPHNQHSVLYQVVVHRYCAHSHFV